jgi:mRNA interferase YafQ
LNLVYTGRFKKDFKRMMGRNKDEGKLWDIVNDLLAGRPLPAKCKDHSLGGKWSSRRDCHIESDWLLIYCVRGDELILERTGSHSDLFR